LATTAETVTGTDATKAVTPAGYSAAVACCYIAKSAIAGKGTLITGTAANTPSTLATGTNGQVLTVDTTCTSGLKWAAASAASEATPESFGTVYGFTDDPAMSFTGGNLGLGYCSMWQLSFGNNGRFNTAVGSCSGKALGIGESNTAIGYVALCSSYDGSENTAVGAFSGCSIGVGRNNTSLGAFSLCSNNAGCSNIAIGASALKNMTCGYNTAVGFYSLFSANTGQFNVALGFESGCAITSGNCNVVIGPCAQPASATGSCQLAIGFASGQNWLTGDSTKAIRPGAGIIDCTGSCGTPGQILISNGNSICWSSATGASATPTAAGVVLGCTNANTAALGCSALAITTGTFNTALGVCAGDSITTGSRNVIIGPEAEVALATGSCQLAIGFNATNNWLTGDSSKHIRPGAGIRDCNGNLGGSNQFLCSTGTAVQWATPVGPGLALAANLLTVWGATTTAPSPGGGCFGMSCRQAGDKYYQIIIGVCKSAGGTAGSGDYLFTLPNGLQFNTGTQPPSQAIYTANIGASSLAFMQTAIPGATGYITDGVSTYLCVAPVVYSATQFRVLTVGGGNFRPWGSGWFAASSAICMNMNFQFVATT
jgi:hypothetical protein